MAIRPEIREFAEMMEYKLSINDFKGGVDRSDIQRLFDLLLLEVGELEAAVELSDPEEIAMEAADVANFALMIAWVTTRGPFGKGEKK